MYTYAYICNTSWLREGIRQSVLMGRSGIDMYSCVFGYVCIHTHVHIRIHMCYILATGGCTAQFLWADQG
jgi:hypothetical protein